MSILSGFLKTKRHRLTDEGYIVQSEWTSASSVEFDDGMNAEEKIQDIEKQISSISTIELDTTLSVEGQAADAKAVGDAINVRCNTEGYLEVKIDGVWEQTKLKTGITDDFYIIKDNEILTDYSFGTVAVGNASVSRAEPTISGTTVSLNTTGIEGTFYISSIDVTDYSELVIEHSLTHNTTSCQTYLYLMNSIPTYNNYSDSAIAQIDYYHNTLNNAHYSKSLDISSLSGKYYIVGWLYYGEISIEFENVYLK